MQMYFDELVKRSGKKVGELFPNFNVMVQGGVNFEPYKAKLFESIGKKIDTIELFPASEGFCVPGFAGSGWIIIKYQ